MVNYVVDTIICLWHYVCKLTIPNVYMKEMNVYKKEMNAINFLFTSLAVSAMSRIIMSVGQWNACSNELQKWLHVYSVSLPPANDLACLFAKRRVKSCTSSEIAPTKQESTNCVCVLTPNYARDGETKYRHVCTSLKAFSKVKLWNSKKLTFLNILTFGICVLLMPAYSVKVE